MAEVDFYSLTPKQYSSIANKDNDALYFLTNGEIYKGDTLLSNNVEIIPNDEDIASIEVIYGDAKGKIAEQEQISVISGMLKKGQSTRIQSVNDTPPSEYNYFTVRLFDKNGDWDDVFVYSDGNSIYIEQPYQGVYKSDKELIEVLNSITVKEN